jgi:hypothetical protein
VGGVSKELLLPFLIFQLPWNAARFWSLI